MGELIVKPEQLLKEITQTGKQFLQTLNIPKGFDANKAIIEFTLAVGQAKDKNNKPALEVCTKESIVQCLKETLTECYSLSKDQAYLIVYGDKLSLQPSYFGNEARAKLFDDNLQDVPANVIYKGDIFEYEIDSVTGRKRVTKHEQKFENISDKNIVGAYATAVFKDGTSYIDIMSYEEIKQAWSMSRTGNATHNKFGAEMAKKTVISRITKSIIKTSNDESVLDDTDKLFTNDRVIIDIDNEDSIVRDDFVEKEETANEQEEEIIEGDYTVANDDDIFPDQQPDFLDETPATPSCAKCGKDVTQKVADYSSQKFNEIRCFECQKA